MKYRIEELETAAHEKKDWRFMIHTALGWAYLNSLEAGNDLPNFGDVIWEKDIPEILAGCRKYGIKEFTISSTFSGLINTVAEFEKNGCHLDGLVRIKGHKDIWTKEREIIPAFKMTVN